MQNTYKLTTPDGQFLNNGNLDAGAISYGIVSPIGGAIGDATVGDVLLGRTFSNAVTMGLTGTLIIPPSGVGVVPTGQYTAHPVGAPFRVGDDAFYAGALPTLDYTDNGDGTVTDNNTNLMWVKEPGAIGGVWGAPGTPALMSWNVGLDECELLNYAGHSDWRMPNIKELMSIVDFSRMPSCIDPAFTFVQLAGYWSSTTYATMTAMAWQIKFSDGGMETNIKVNFDFVRPVRTATPLL